MKTIMLNHAGHSVFAPSSSEMWLTCSGSLIANMVERQSKGDSGNEAAAEGTVAHEIAEEWLTTGRKPIERIGEIQTVNGYDVEITEEMLMYVADYVNWCNDQEGRKFVEVKVDFSHLTPVPNQRGTSDHVCCTDDKLTITDLKYGIGVKVYAENNTQLQMYALGVLNDFGYLYDFKTVEMRICQPRLGHFSTWEISVEQLLKFGDYVKQRAIAAWQPDAPRKVSEKGCLWCMVKATCPEMVRELEEMCSDIDWENEEDDVIKRIEDDRFLEKFKNIDELHIEHLEKIHNKIKPIKSYLAEVEKKVFDFLQKGGKMQSIKLVAGRNTRRWIDENETVKFLSSNGFDEDEYAPRELVSPAQAEKLCKTAKIPLSDLSGLIANREGKPTIAPIDDIRPVYDVDAGVDWGDAS